jgi:hypothetical protein
MGWNPYITSISSHFINFLDMYKMKTSSQSASRFQNTFLALRLVLFLFACMTCIVPLGNPVRGMSVGYLDGFFISASKGNLYSTKV